MDTGSILNDLLLYPMVLMPPIAYDLVLLVDNIFKTQTGFSSLRSILEPLPNSL